MKDRFWKTMAVIAVLLWIATLCTWYVIKTIPPRYIKSAQLILDTKENKFYHYSYRRWMPCTLPYTEYPQSKDIQWKYIEEITGYKAERYKSINNNLSANTIIQGLDQNKFSISELREAVKKFTYWELDNIFKHRDWDDPEWESEYLEVIQSIDNPNLKALFPKESFKN